LHQFVEVWGSFRHEGRITLDWNVVESEGKKSVRLWWAETDGPDVQNVASGGFGTVVLKRVAPQAVSGAADLQFGPNGVAWTLDAPIAYVEASLSDGEGEEQTG
jgi:two-component sensor histidine kinase